MRHSVPLVCCGLWSSLAAAELLGPRYPSPIDLTSKTSLLQKAWQNLTDIFDGHLKGNTTDKFLIGVENITFSVGAFSIHDSDASDNLQYHYTAPEIRNSVEGVKKVDGDSVYRMASVSKLFTAYTGMVLLNEEEWNRPLSKIFPDILGEDSGNSITEITKWNEVTPLTLASQISGVVGNAAPWVVVEKSALPGVPLTPETNPVTWGLPPLEDKYPFAEFCEDQNSDCGIEDFLKSTRDTFPTYETHTSPTYSNYGFILLGAAISKLSGKSFDDTYTDALFKPLGMKSSNSSDPLHLVDRTVVPAGLNASDAFFFDSGLGAASGGVTSTLNDLAKLSTSILNSTLISKEKTRKWMKPLAHTADLQSSLGVGWEIIRYVHPEGTASAGAVTDLYTKMGDAGFNGGIAVLVPEYGAGFNCLIVSSDPNKASYQRLVFDAVLREIMPALEAQAVAESGVNFAGTYVSSDLDQLNSSLTLGVNSRTGGLSVVEWISNSTNILEYQPYIYGSANGLRLLPTIPDPENGKYAYRITSMPNATENALATSVGPFTGELTRNVDWILTGQTTYGGVPIDLAIFDVSDDGKATGISIPAFNVTLEREAE